MHTSIKNLIATLLLFFACIGFTPAFASHIVGGGFTYRYLGDTVVSGITVQKYEVTLDLYQDCVTGVPDAISQDNPAYFTVYQASTPASFLLNDSVFYDQNPASGGSIIIPTDNINTLCGTISAANMKTQLCLLRKRFIKRIYLPANSTGYVVVYQRCCRNSSIVNVTDPGDKGSTFFCNIPPAPLHNNSAVFNNYPPQVMCMTQTMIFDHAATDADGDSLSYELCSAYDGASGLDIKPKIADPPPYSTVDYFPPYSYESPMTAYPPLQIDPVTGRMTVTPNHIGRYLIGVLCKEWRGGVLINTMRREFQCIVINCSDLVGWFKPGAGKNQTILVGEKINFHATGGARYQWLPGDFLSNPYIADPVGTFTDPGTFTYVLNAVSDSGCSGSDTVTITVLGHSDFAVPNAFTPNGDGRNDVLIPVAVGNSTLKNFRVYNRTGIIIYHTTNSGEGWDGTYKGSRQDIGVYSWAIEYTDNAGTQRVKGGNVTLLR